MIPVSMTILSAFIGVALLAGGVAWLLYERFVRYPDAVRKRLESVGNKTKSKQEMSILDVQVFAGSASHARNRFAKWLRSAIAQSGLKIEFDAVLIIAGVLAMAAACIATLLTQRLWIGALAGLLAAALPFGEVWRRRGQRIRRMTAQLPDALDVISRGVNAGQTVPASFRMIADDFPAPISDEFRDCYEQQNLGIPFEAALRNMAARTGTMELRILVVAFLVQSQAGGNLSDVLRNLSATVRRRATLQQKLKTLTSEGRMQAAVLIALPFVVFFAIYILNRDYAEVLLTRPKLLAACMASQLLGALCIQRLIRIDY